MSKIEKIYKCDTCGKDNHEGVNGACNDVITPYVSLPDLLSELDRRIKDLPDVCSEGPHTCGYDQLSELRTALEGKEDL